MLCPIFVLFCFYSLPKIFNSFFPMNKMVDLAIRSDIEIREATAKGRREAKVLNREEGTYLLSHIYDHEINGGKETNSHQRLIP